MAEVMWKGFHGTDGAPKTPSSALPPPGGRFSPSRSGAGLCREGGTGCAGAGPTSGGETQCVSLAARKTRQDGAFFRLVGGCRAVPVTLAEVMWKGFHGADGAPKAPSSALPMEGASRPPGRALVSVVGAEPVARGPVLHRAGKRDAFPSSPEGRGRTEHIHDWDGACRLIRHPVRLGLV
jgi:hypothetical protein